jgi:thymidine kinase
MSADEKNINDPAPPTGYLQVIIGSMYAGKSTELQRIHGIYSLKHNVVVINHASDTRYGSNAVVTHKKNSLPAISLSGLDKELWNRPEFKEAEVILLDEAQFFSNDQLVEFVIFALEYGKKLFVFGLSGDANMKKFGGILDLIPLADDIVHLKGVCQFCPNAALNAPFSRWVASEEMPAGQTHVGADEYVPVCRKHHKHKI